LHSRSPATTDLPDRNAPCFLPSLEGAARTAIDVELDRQRSAGSPAVLRAARAVATSCSTRNVASGIATTIVLPFAPDEFAKTSIEGADGDCLRRFRRQGPIHLIALRDGEDGDGPGGTAEMVNQAAGGGDHPHIIAPQDLPRS
jgi:hypothetical protein